MLVRGVRLYKSYCLRKNIEVLLVAGVNVTQSEFWKCSAYCTGNRNKYPNILIVTVSEPTRRDVVTNDGREVDR